MLINLIIWPYAYHFVLAAHSEVLGSILLWLKNRAMHRVFKIHNIFMHGFDDILILLMIDIQQ